MMKAFCKPRIKVGTEWVTKGQNIDQSMSAVGGIARAIYDRIFKWLIIKVDTGCLLAAHIILLDSKWLLHCNTDF